MNFDSLSSFKAAPDASFAKGPFAILIAEDRVELASSLDHLHSLAFKAIFILAPDEVAVPDAPKGAKCLQHIIRHPSRQLGATQAVVNALIEKVPGQWIHYCYNGEYLFYPFCEDRTIGELVTWVMEERRESVLTYVVDLYAGDLSAHPNAVDLDGALLDSSGYYAETRRGGPELDEVMERQLNFYGGLRWRFEEHVAKPKRKIDRVGLFRAAPGLTLREDHTLSDEELNTYACPWHHSLSASICSFRVAKALRTNPGSRHDIPDFRWHKSTQFHWSSMQLMELGLMEPGQWF
ncbi:hypothetical protein KUL25_18605 [Rhodobacteraceae bacterium N5(2021)]|uniref:Glycosyl transferase family 2 n=1 Tax=Gymnodinialimonas phycosphaerae TaxID=2841589 RepID=A0A975TU03_9RHOB|nr:hypothetical protein [Gymnodinialimonas phycosphaerae]MBY4894773.1 hypothetical protein [Gymnodinialimonas phycosphaerae]